MSSPLCVHWGLSGPTHLQETHPFPHPKTSQTPETEHSQWCQWTHPCAFFIPSQSCLIKLPVSISALLVAVESEKGICLILPYLSFPLFAFTWPLSPQSYMILLFPHQRIPSCVYPTPMPLWVRACCDIDIRRILLAARYYDFIPLVLWCSEFWRNVASK